jgi:hypothetical protein
MTAETGQRQMLRNRRWAWGHWREPFDVDVGAVGPVNMNVGAEAAVRLVSIKLHADTPTPATTVGGGLEIGWGITLSI